MANRYSQLFYHFIWTTRGREPVITAEREPPLYRYIRHKCESLGVFIHALNGMPDHVHLACTLPTTLSVAGFLEVIKGSSAHFINHLPDASFRLYWQSGYGALTFSRRDLPQIRSYIDNQKTHHDRGDLSPAMERDSEL